LDDLQAAEAGMREAVRLGLFERVAERTHELADRYDHSSELLDAWSSDDEVWMSPDLERRLRSTTDSVDVFERLVLPLSPPWLTFRLAAPLLMRGLRRDSCDTVLCNGALLGKVAVL
jgi:hypothetical protein